MPTSTEAPPAPPARDDLARRRVPLAGAGRLASRRRRDKGARVVVTIGGLAIIASILGIFLFLLVEVLPLFGRAHVDPRPKVVAPAVAPLALFCDEGRTHVALLGADGVVRVVRQRDAAVVAEQRLLAPAAGAATTTTTITCGASLIGASGFVAASSDGRVAWTTVDFASTYTDSGTQIEPKIAPPFEVEIDPEKRPVRACGATLKDDTTAIVATRADGDVVLLQRVVEENLLTGERTPADTRRILRAPSPAERLLIDARRENVYGATADGQLLWWSLGDAAATDALAIGVGAPVTAMTLLIGDQSLVVGQRDGSLSVWFRAAREGARPLLQRVRDFPPLAAAVRSVERSWRDRTFLAQDERGGLCFAYSTSGRVLWSGASPLPGATAAALAPKMNGALLAAAGAIVPLDYECRHPEASLQAFFSEVWYEGYAKPEYVWQSSSGSDEAEPKFCLAPLVFGTLKATLFSLLFAVPLALLAAMYTSQFMHWTLRRYVKPAVEIMASLPSVVLGFLAGVWLAPRVAQFFLGVPLFLLLFPGAILLSGRLGERLPARFRHRFPDGSAALAFVGVAAVTLVVAVGLCRPLEVSLFGGDFIGWLRRTLGITYDSKNCVVLGLAMGMAVIPIVFAIAEDAFSNVPRSLVSGSLALGADQWYTVTRVVLPTASPGLFSAVMIGFGRAVGETMIVVMASGNTPIMDWSIFNGLRSLSANVATEIPEAAQGGTLYRTLFLAALLLFALTFVANTAAELVRQHLRQKYARL